MPSNTQFSYTTDIAVVIHMLYDMMPFRTEYCCEDEWNIKTKF